MKWNDLAKISIIIIIVDGCVLFKRFLSDIRKNEKWMQGQ